MKLPSKLFLLGFGSGIVAALALQYRQRGQRRPSESIPADPEIEAALDLAALDQEIDDSRFLEIDSSVDVAEVIHDTGDLYGVHAMGAVNRDHPDNDRAMDEGQNWLEALEANAAEFGADLERPLDMSDELSAPGHNSDSKDTPVADRGAGGPGGL